MPKQVGDCKGQFKGLGLKDGGQGRDSDLSNTVKAMTILSLAYTPLTSVSRAFFIKWVQQKAHSIITILALAFLRQNLYF